MKSIVTVNDVVHEVTLDVDRTLLTFLREELDLTGTKLGCGEGECSACAVLVGAQKVHSCVTPLAEVVNQRVTTIEGLAEEEYLHPVQQAFLDEGAMQCGYCTAGWIIGTAALLNRSSHPTENEIATELADHVCRCCTYPRIRKAIHRAAELLRDPQLVEDSPPFRSMVSEQCGEEDRPWDLADPGDQGFFELLGDGLVSLVPAGQDLGRAELSDKPSRRVGGTWIHLAPNGLVTAFSGKVEIGQGTRTALAMLVAEELRISPNAVAMVMGDTALSPYDAGTSGSRSMIEIGECLRAAGAAARRVLLKLAADELGVDLEDLTLSDGEVFGPDGPDGSERLTWNEILKGRQELAVVDSAAWVTAPRDWTVAGRPTRSLTASDVVTGRRRYPYDLVSPGMRYGKILRPPSFGAVLTEVAFPEPDPTGEVVYVHDDQFVGVAAPSTARANEALARIVARWKVVPQPSEAELEAHLRANPITSGGQNTPFHRDKGDVDAALEDSSTRLRATYHAAYLAHVPLEARSALAKWNGEYLTVWTGTQRPFPVRKLVAEHFSMPEERVRIVVPDFGSGFGGKHLPDVAIEAARLARAAGRPVKLQWTRAEEFTWAYFRPAAIIDVDAGLDDAGRIRAWSFMNLNSGPAGVTTPYSIDHQRIDFQPAASPLAHGSYRALAATANNFARESHMDDLARLAGMDPVEFRLCHLDDERLAAVLRRLAEQVGWGGGEPGWGIAVSSEKSSYLATAAQVRIADRRRLEVCKLVSVYECGAIVNPDNVTNQAEGAMVMALGGALFEAIHFGDGKISNGSMAAYRVPRLSDVPEIEVILIDRPDLPSVGASETPMVGVAPAIANAICGLTGVRIRSMPLVPDGTIPEA